MKRLFSTLMVSMFAFGFCVSLSGCGEPAAEPAADTTGEAADAGGEAAGSDSKAGSDKK
jgi:hypothetical protein